MEAKDLAAADQRARRRRRRAALAAAAVAFALAGAGPAEASNHVPQEFWGVVPIADLSGAEIEQMGAGNVGSVRQLTLWPAIEPERGQFDWRYTDFLVATTAS